MYGFGDDRNPANDTVSVMEEILIEYITDIVRLSSIGQLIPFDLLCLCSVRPLRGLRERTVFLSMICAGHCRGPQMQRSLPVWRSYCSCRKTSNVLAHSSKSRTYNRQRDCNYGVRLSISVTALHSGHSVSVDGCELEEWFFLLLVGLQIRGHICVVEPSKYLSPQWMASGDHGLITLALLFQRYRSVDVIQSWGAHVGNRCHVLK